MEEQSLIHTERNFPSTITKDEEILGGVREELLLSAVDTFIQAVQPINVPLDELVSLVKEKYTKKKDN